MKKYLNEIKKIQQYLNEVKATSLTVGETFTVSGDIGKFKEGEKVSVDDIRPFGNDVELHLSNSEGVKDTFYLDINDDFEQLVPEAKRLQKLAGIVNEQDEEVPQENPDEPTPEEAPTPETPPGSISKEQAEQLIRATKGKFFTVTFIKKDGTVNTFPKTAVQGQVITLYDSSFGKMNTAYSGTSANNMPWSFQFPGSRYTDACKAPTTRANGYDTTKCTINGFTGSLDSTGKIVTSFVISGTGC
jgi:hypothetical protein